MDNIQKIFLSCTFLVSIIQSISTRDAASSDSLIERIARLEERDRIQQNEINRLDERDQIQMKRIAHLEERDRLQKDEIDILTENVKFQQEEISDMRKQLLIQKRKTPHNLIMCTRHMEAQKKKRHVHENKLVNEVEDTLYDSNRRKLFKQYVF